VFFLSDGDLEAAQVAAAVVGACLGFLIHNFNPASIFMGDAGSLFLGFLVAGLSLAGTYPYSRSTVSVLLFPVLLLLVPIFDTTFVTIARTLAGRPVSRGGRDHTSHRLVASGLSERAAVLLLYSVALACGALAFHAYTAGLSSTIVLIVFLGIGLLLFGLYLGRVQVYPEAEAAKVPDGALVWLVDRFPLRQIGTVFLDSLLIVAAYYSAYRLRFEQTYAQNEPWFTTSLPIVLACQLLTFTALRVYQGSWRYTGLTDLIRLGKASFLGTTLAIVALVVLYRFDGYSRAVFVIDGVLLFMCVGASRLSFRLFGELLRGQPAGLQRVLIYGAGDAGELVLREIRNAPRLGRLVVGFLDDNRWKHRSLIHGVPVLGSLDRLDSILESYQIDQVIVSSSRIPADRLDLAADVCERRGVPMIRASRHLDGVIAS
jgi:UDP-GlcNAc:undecaprenyl-phosphate GlcNAc-1-phosphate transferase